MLLVDRPHTESQEFRGFTDLMLVLEKIFQSPLDIKEIKYVIPKGNKP